jgi:hypothetical protein
MRLHLDRDGRASIRGDKKRVLDRRKRDAVESDVHYRPANGDHPTIDSSRLSDHFGHFPFASSCFSKVSEEQPMRSFPGHEYKSSTGTKCHYVA